MTRVFWTVCALVALLGRGTEVVAQVARAAERPAVSATRPQLDYFVSRYYQTAAEQDAVGGRLMWPLEGRPGGWMDRTAMGAYLIRTARDDQSVDSWRFGAQADLRMTRSRLAGRLEPIVSLGVGALRVEESRWETPAPPRAPVTGPLQQTHTHFSLIPGLGVRLQLMPGIGLRGDARQAIDFGDGERRKLEISGGLSVGV